MHRSRSLLSPLALVLLLGVSLIFACDDEDDEIGTPCESEADCSEALICDLHDGQGTCQRDHDH
jgi:hypothetical protein